MLAFFPLWHRWPAPGLGGRGKPSIQAVVLPNRPPNWRALARRFQTIRHLEQGTAIKQEPLDVVQAGDFLGILFDLAIQLQLHGPQALFQLHQSLGQGMHGLGQIFSVAADAEGNRLGSHGGTGTGADDNTQTGAGQEQTAHSSLLRRPRQAESGLDHSLGDRYVGLSCPDVAPPAMVLSLSCLLCPAQRPWLSRAVLRVALASAIGGTGLGIGLGSQPGLAQTAEANTAAASAGAGGKGAQIYCFMRNNGNNHTVSWDAAYAVIKRQNDKLFKTSPEHAAVMITEAVVQNPSVYPDCGRYLGDLFTKPEPKPDSNSSTTPTGVTRNERLGQ
jgi:hypothetical protein